MGSNFLSCPDGLRRLFSPVGETRREDAWALGTALGQRSRAPTEPEAGTTPCWALSLGVVSPGGPPRGGGWGGHATSDPVRGNTPCLWVPGPPQPGPRQGPMSGTLTRLELCPPARQPLTKAGRVKGPRGVQPWGCRPVAGAGLRLAGVGACCRTGQHRQVPGSPLTLLADLGSLAPLSLNLVVCRVGTARQPGTPPPSHSPPFSGGGCTVGRGCCGRPLYPCGKIARAMHEC